MEANIIKISEHQHSTETRVRHAELRILRRVSDSETRSIAELSARSLRARLGGKMAKPLQPPTADPLKATEGVETMNDSVAWSNNPRLVSASSAAPKLRSAFTLAEVLITLGIIGVVAAMTLPTLIQNYKKHVVETKLAKFYTTINQAVAMSSTENGEPADWVKDCGSSSNPTCTTDDFTDWFKTYIGKYMSYTKIEPAEDNISVYIYFSDGSIMRWENCIYDLDFYLSKKAVYKNSRGIDSFMFRFSWKDSTSENTKFNRKNSIEPYVTYWDGKIETLYEGHSFSCSRNGAFCTKLIQVNGWKIPKDYPLKF